MIQPTLEAYAAAIIGENTCTQTSPTGETLYRFMCATSDGHEFITWAPDMNAAINKVWRTRGFNPSRIRYAGDPLSDRPNR